MKLKRVDIKNFRSIKETTVEFDNRCRILVGINESGKTNVLAALSFLGERDPDPTKDVREPLKKEDPVKESYVRFVFTLSDSEISSLNDEVSSQIGAKTANPVIATETKSGKNIKLHSFGKKKSEGLYRINVLENSKSARYWTISGYNMFIL